MANFEVVDGSYIELGGGLVEDLVKALEEPLGRSVNLYDDDSAELIEQLFNTTVSLTIGFSFALVLYYVTIIWALLNRLKYIMLSEFRFYMFLPKNHVGLDESNASSESINDTTKVVFS
jgi:hypothetical protein